MSRGGFFEVTKNLPCRPLSLSKAVVDRDAPVGVPGQEKPWSGPQACLNAPVSYTHLTLPTKA